LVFRTSNLQADIDPLLEGEHIYLIKTRNLAGTYSSLFSAVTVLVPEVSTIAITSKVIDNNILLSWTEPTSFFSVDHYDVYRNGVKVGTQKGTFAVYFEQIPGDFNYGIVSVDVAGNESVLVEIEVIVLQPPDFDLQDEFDSALDGDRVDVALLSGPKLLANVNLTETWEEHFVNNSYTSPADQIADGYPWYVQPTPGPGTYDEKIDFGTILNNVIVNLTYNVVNLAGTMTILVEMAASDDDITYSTYTSGSTQFFTSFRYIKIRLTFTGSDDHALVELDQLHLALNVKREVDAGQVDALAADVTGTAVTFNKDFKDIESLTATVRQTTTALIVVIDFVDVPDPTGFSVYVYDTGGTRQDATVDWKARGII
jgi:hypothetical protein